MNICEPAMIPLSTAGRTFGLPDGGLIARDQPPVQGVEGGRQCAVPFHSQSGSRFRDAFVGVPGLAPS
jgi:hypothetical protein